MDKSKIALFLCLVSMLFAIDTSGQQLDGGYPLVVGGYQKISLESVKQRIQGFKEQGILPSKHDVIEAYQQAVSGINYKFVHKRNGENKKTCTSVIYQGFNGVASLTSRACQRRNGKF